MKPVRDTAAGWLAPHQPHCLGCGDENPSALGLRFRRVPDGVVGEIRLDRRHEGAPGFAHGGFVALLLDEAFGMTILVREFSAVTARLEVDYRLPVRIGQRVLAEARLDHADGRKLSLSGSVRGEDGTVLAQATGLFITVGREHFLEDGEAAGSEGPLPW